MSNMNDLDFEQSHEFLLEHKNEFNKFKTDFDNLYSKYKNRSKIIVLLDYWIFNVLLLKKIYGSEGLVNFCNSYINNPQRFSFFYELDNLNKADEIRFKKNNSRNFYVLKFFIRKIFIPGAHLDNFLKKFLNLISLKFILSIPVKADQEIENRLNQILKSIFKNKFNESEIKLILKKVPKVFISSMLSVPFTKISVSGSSSSFLEYEGFENIFLLNSNLYIEGVQHGGGYDIFKVDYFVDYEKNLCDKFFGWGFSENNIHQTKFKRIFKKTPENIQRVLWIEDSKVPSFYFYSMPHQHHQSINIKSKKYIYKELNRSQIEYTSMFHPSSKSDLYKNFRRNSFNIPSGGQSEKNFYLNDILIFDNSGSTLIHFAIENQMIFYHIISRLDYENFTELQKEFFLIQRKYNFGIFNDEENKLANSISNIKLDDNFSLPEDLIEFYENNFR
tara:strand:- start:13028 stop:14365 length:1338 start_codon:yes stop_codon:yes gene_type:complete